MRHRKDMNKPNPITLHGVATGYPTPRNGFHTVCRDMCATAPAATLTCIIGRNGTGKSTLLRTIARLQPPHSGDISIGGDSLARLNRRQLSRRLSIVLTSRPDSDDLRVGELAALGRTPYTDFWGRLSAADREAASRALAMVGMEGMAGRRVCSLSDGECQKAMIAKSLAQDTPVILLDEPTAFLDYPGKVELMLLLARLAHNEGKTVLLSTHDIETALQTADRLWLLRDGGIEEGTPHELAASGAIEAYIGRDDVKLDPSSLSLRITHTLNNHTTDLQL